MATEIIPELQTFEPVNSFQPVVGLSQKHDKLVGKALPLVVDTTTTTATSVLSKTRAVVVVTLLMGSALFSSLCNGIIVVSLPAIANTLNLDKGLLLWPTSAFYLTAGSCLLMAGSIADVAGTKRVNLTGSLLCAAFAIGCGLAQTGGQLIAFRALQGLSNAILTPSSISIISKSMENGRPRNIGFGCLGVASPIGFSLGLVLSGVFVDSIGWRPAFYFTGSASFVIFLIGIWVLPRDARSQQGQSVWKRLASEIDWVGAILASVGVALLSYVLAALSADIQNIRRADNIAFLIISAASIPAFVGWMHYQVKHDRRALIPNSLWHSPVFTSSCIMVLFATAVTNCMELFSSFFFQDIQKVSALGTSLRILPSLIAGALTNLSTGIFVNRMPVMWVVLVSSGISAIAPLLMALIHPKWPYWYDGFLAQILTPLSCDMLFTVGLLVVSDVFPKHMQALSGAVFNTCAQLGTAIGLSVTSVIATSRTDASHFEDKVSPDALMVGYRAVFFTLFSWMVFVCLVCVLGLRRVGGIGLKRD